MLNRRTSYIVLAFLVLIFIIDVIFSISLYEYEVKANYGNKKSYYQHSAIFSGPFTYYIAIALDWVGKHIDHISVALTAAATVYIAKYTITLAEATNALKSLAKRQEETSKTHERAFIFCGGLFGVPKQDPLPYEVRHRQDASWYNGPWRMVLHNYGRTPGFVTRIEWGVCPEKAFLPNVPISRIIDRQMLEKYMRPVVEVREVFAPTEGTPVPYRYVECERRNGEVFFGRIRYDDVFGKSHHSTFALLHGEHHSDTVGNSFAEDWN